MTTRPQVALPSVTGLTVTARANRIRILFDLRDPGDIDLGALMCISVGGSALVTIEGLQATLPLEQSPETAVPADGQIVFVAVNEPTPTYHITRTGAGRGRRGDHDASDVHRLSRALERIGDCRVR